MKSNSIISITKNKTAEINYSKILTNKVSMPLRLKIDGVNFKN